MAATAPLRGDVTGPPLPPGRRVVLPGRGRTFVREVTSNAGWGGAIHPRAQFGLGEHAPERLVEGEIVDVLSLDKDPAAVRHQQAEQQLQNRGLARSRRANDMHVPDAMFGLEHDIRHLSFVLVLANLDALTCGNLRRFLRAFDQASEFARKHRRSRQMSERHKLIAVEQHAIAARATVQKVELVRIVGCGSYGDVWLARGVTGAWRAIKIVWRDRFTTAEPFEREEPREVGIDELAKSWGDRADPRILSRAVELGLLRDLGNRRYEERSPRLARAGLELARLGIDPETGLDVIATARRHADGVAESYVQLFLNEIWKPFVAAGRPQERWPEVRDALERLRPLAAEVLLAVFGLAMTEATERAFGRELDLIKDEVRRDEAA